jgi:hypothetical protein
VSFGVLIVLIVIGTTIWVGVDASKRDWGEGSGTGTWVVGCILLWIVVFPVYLAKRGKAPFKAAPALAAGPPGLAPSDPMYRECPHCKEPMRRDAGICPHCRKPSTAWRYHDGRWWLRPDEDKPWQWYDERSGLWVRLETDAT